MVIKCLCFDGVKNSENCTFRFRKLYVSFSRLYFFKIFSQKFEMTPKKYREQMRKDITKTNLENS